MNRLKSIFHREKTQAFVQTDGRDVVDKGNSFPERFEIYFNHADEIYIYWTDDIMPGKESSLAAIYSRKRGFEVIDKTAFEKSTQAYGHLPKIEECRKF